LETAHEKGKEKEEKEIINSSLPYHHCGSHDNTVSAAQVSG